MRIARDTDWMRSDGWSRIFVTVPQRRPAAFTI
jgi:hypothetical protein